MGFWDDARKARHFIKDFGGAAKKTGDAADKVNTARKVNDVAKTSNLIKDCESKLEKIGKDDIPVSASTPTETGKFIQLALHVDADGKVGNGTIEALNKRIEEEFATKPKGSYRERFKNAVSNVLKDEFEDLKGRRYNDASDIDGRTVQFLSQSVYGEGAFCVPTTLRTYTEAMKEIAEESGNQELQVAAHKLASEIVAAPENAPVSGRAEPELSSALGMG
ncbi:MAG: hypothetical protein KAJ29_04485 [Alphaproteobacteria bacterium]|nr:hypothetical protein [Alphaproteobacteria bacterium]